MRNRLLGAAMAVLMLASPSYAAAPGPTVRVDVGEGHGSGVSIGGGLILTAAHVVANVKGGVVKIKTDQGQFGPARVKWINPYADVAVLEVDPNAPIGIANLMCKDPSVGDVIHSEGNPTVMEFVTTYGHVAGAKQELFGRQVVVTDLTVAEGSSGGPVFDANGNVVGVVSALFLQPMSAGGKKPKYYPVPTGYSMMVPGSTICALLGRTS